MENSWTLKAGIFVLIVLALAVLLLPGRQPAVTFHGEPGIVLREIPVETYLQVDNADLAWGLAIEEHFWDIHMRPDTIRFTRPVTTFTGYVLDDFGVAEGHWGPEFTATWRKDPDYIVLGDGEGGTVMFADAAEADRWLDKQLRLHSAITEVVCVEGDVIPIVPAWKPK